MMQVIFGIFIFLLGLIIGSFLNCVIYRLEKGETLKGRSYCPHCKHALSWMDLVPVLSFLLLGGKCRYCHKKISWQYPLVELSTGLAFLLVFSFPYPVHNFFNLVFLFYIISSLIIIFVYDLRHYIIPDKILFPAIAISLIYRLFSFGSLLNYVVAAIVASGFFLAIFLLSKGDWMGFGDVKLAILLGLILGWPNIIVGLFLAFFFGAIIGSILLILHKKGLKSEMPFAPFLIFGTFLVMLFGGAILHWYLHFFLV